MKKNLSAFVSGLLFAVGLILSGMTRPANILGFLDFWGEWKPALLFVMAGALGVYAIVYPRVRRRKTPLFAETFDVPPPARVDARLVVGSAAFGIGWGMGGFCPGPALTALASFSSDVLVFLAAFFLAVALHHFATRTDPRSHDISSCG